MAALWLASRGADRMCLGFMLVAILAVQPVKLVPIGDVVWIVFAVVWLATFDAMRRHIDTKNNRQIAALALTLLSAMCYAWGRFGGYSFGHGAPIVLADLFGLSAVMMLGGPGLGLIIANCATLVRGVLMGGDSYRRGRGRGYSGGGGSMARKEVQ
jgi:hypothetical protein